MRKLKAAAGVAALVLALAAAGCGGGGGSGSGSASKASPKDWVHTVCSAVGAMKSAVTTGQAELRTSLAGISTSGKPDLTKARDALVTFLGKVQGAAQKARDQIVNVGTPDVSKGDKLQQALSAGLDKLVSSLDTAKSRAEKLSTTDAAAFVSETKKVAQVGSSIGSSLAVLGTYKSAELDKAARGDSACKAINAG